MTTTASTTAPDTPPVVAPPARRADYPALNGVRAVAAYSVVATHSAFQTGRSLQDAHFAGLLARLNFGVTLFFLLSGFLLSRQFLTVEGRRLHIRTVGRFWWRRLLRVLPAYWLAIAGSLWLLTPRPASTKDWYSYLLLVQMYDHHYADPTLSQMWTLAVEVLFYGALPILLGVALRAFRNRTTSLHALLVAMLLGSLGANLAVHQISTGASPALLWFPVYLDWFALGIALAVLAVMPERRFAWQRVSLDLAESTALCWVLGALFFWLSTLPLGGPRFVAPATTWEWSFQHYLFAAAAFCFLLPLVVGREAWPQRMLGNRVMTWLGEISYGVYLWHLGLLIALQRWIGWRPFTGHFLAMFLLTAAAATAVAAVSWHVVERPLLRRFSHSLRRAARSQAVAEQQRERNQAAGLQPGAAGQRAS